jgi:hypothetical protein
VGENGFDVASWSRALTLRERLAALREAASPGRLDAAQGERAARRLQRWRSQPPFEDAARFVQRLSADGITEAQLLYLLGTEAAAHGPLAPPEWAQTLLDALPHHPGGSLVDPWSSALYAPAQNLDGFLEVAHPLIRQERARLAGGIRELAAGRAILPFDPATIEGILFASLPEQLFPVLSRTLVLELNVARLQGELGGDTPEERFQHFVRRLRDPGCALALFHEYPVLARQVVGCIESWGAASLEFLSRLTADWDAICATF